jgi:hypothetical protein
MTKPEKITAGVWAITDKGPEHDAVCITAEWKNPRKDGLSRIARARAWAQQHGYKNIEVTTIQRKRRWFMHGFMLTTITGVQQ